MRTTLTLDDDVAARLEQLRRDRDESLKDIVNDALRRGLDDLTRRPQQESRSGPKVLIWGGYDCPASTTSAKLSLRLKMKPSNYSRRRKYSGLFPREITCATRARPRLARSATQWLDARRTSLGKPAGFPALGHQFTDIRAPGDDVACMAPGAPLGRL